SPRPRARACTARCSTGPPPTGGSWTGSTTPSPPAADRGGGSRRREPRDGRARPAGIGQDGPMANVSVSHIGLCVSDLEASLRFYTEGLGFEVAEGFDVGDEVAQTLE